MKRWNKLITRHWRSKLVSLLLALTIWFLIRHSISEETATQSLPSNAARRTQN